MRRVAAGLFWLALATGACLAEVAHDDGPGPAYLAYAGPYSSSPSSAFGHLFLVLPASADEPAPLWDVVSFSAETFDAGAVRYLSVGITGGFLGRYRRLDFHEQTRDYEVLEDRDLWLVRLALTPAQRRALDDEFAATRGRWYPYTFFQRNCAHYLQRLLARATGAIPPPRGAVSPIEVVDHVLASELAGSCHHRPAVSRRLASAADRVPEAVRTRLRREPWTAAAADTAWLRSLPAGTRGFVQEYFGWRALHRRTALPEETRRGLARLRMLLATQPAPPDGPAPVAGPGRPVPPFTFHGYPRLSLGYRAPSRGTPAVTVGYRAALHDARDPWFGHRPLNTLEFLSLAVASPTDRLAPRLERAVLFAQRALAPSDWITTRASWLLEARARRGGVHGADALQIELRAGIGRTRGLGGDTYVYGLITAAGTAHLGDGATFLPGVEAGLVMLASRGWRWGLRWTREHDVGRWTRRQERLHGWLRRDLGRRWGVTLHGRRDRYDERLAVSLDWYP